MVIAAVISLTLLWGVGEYHYRNCTDAAKARNDSGAMTEAEKFDEYVRARRGQQSEREKAIEGCSRLPF